MNNHTAPPETGGSKGDTVMKKTELTLNALQSMNAQEYEDIRAAEAICAVISLTR